MVSTSPFIAVAVAASIFGPGAVFLSLFLGGIRRWKDGGSCVQAVVAGLLLFFVLCGAGSLILMPVGDIYIHDTYFFRLF